MCLCLTVIVRRKKSDRRTAKDEPLYTDIRESVQLVMISLAVFPCKCIEFTYETLEIYRKRKVDLSLIELRNPLILVTKTQFQLWTCVQSFVLIQSNITERIYRLCVCLKTISMAQYLIDENNCFVRRISNFFRALSTKSFIHHCKRWITRQRQYDELISILLLSRYTGDYRYRCLCSVLYWYSCRIISRIHNRFVLS